MEELPVVEEAPVVAAAPPEPVSPEPLVAPKPQIPAPAEAPPAPEPAPSTPVIEAPIGEEPIVMAEAPTPDFKPVRAFTPPPGVTDLAWISGGGEWIQTVRLVTFPIDQITPVGDTLNVIDAVARVLKANPGIKIRIEGHADDNGPARYNQELSDYRAIEVKNYLVSKGIPPRRMEIFGYGESRPMGESETIRGQSENRRVDFRILER